MSVTESPIWASVFIRDPADREAMFWYTFEGYAPSYVKRQAELVGEAMEAAKLIGLSTTKDALNARFSGIVNGSIVRVPQPPRRNNVVSIGAAKKAPLPKAATPKPTKKSEPAPLAEIDWEARLLRNSVGITKTHHNVITIVTHAPEWKGVLAYDEFRTAVIMRSCPPCEDRATFRPGTEWTETATTRAVAYFESKRGLNITKSMALDSILAAAESQRFHPVREYLDSLKWDSKPRLDNLFSRYFGAEDNAYTRAVSSKWTMSAVARSFEPGCQADYMPVIEGKQGRGKSSAIAALVHDRSWFADSSLDLSGKDGYQSLRAKWIIEVAELAAFKGRENEKIKQFVTSRSDNFRASYAKQNRDWPRQCVLIGTTNEAGSYLTDPTGARRYWPIASGEIDVAAIERDRDQLWAEAVHRYKAGESWYLDTPELRELAEEEQQKRAQHDPWEDFIREWLRNPFEWEGTVRMPVDVSEGISTGLIGMAALNLPKKECTPGVEGKIGRIMAKLGWTRKQVRQDDDSRPWLYFRPLSPVVTSAQKGDLVTRNAAN
jgi:putative DNA primase/helicase